MERKNNSGASAGGVTFVGLLQVAFIVLKLCKVINWSWVWVLSPLWISWALVLLIFGIMTIIIKVKGGW